MIKRTIVYTDYNGEPQKMVAYFNLNKAELAEVSVSEEGNYVNVVDQIINEKDNQKLLELFKKLILMSYGKKSPDGQRFIKTQEMRDEFEQTEAFVELFMELMTNEDAAAAFAKGILPKDLQREVAAKQKQLADQDDES